MMNRIQRLQKELSVGEAVLISSNANRLYFTGFKSSAGTLFITQNSADFLIDFRYFEKAQKSITACNVLLAEHSSQQLQEFAEQHQIKTVFVETSYVSVTEFKRFEMIFTAQTVSLDDTLDKKIRLMRSIKEPEEIAKINAAQKITDDTFSYILKHIHPGKTEREIMLDMEFFLRKQGSEGVSFDFIVVSGKNSSLPHGVPTNKPVELGDFITMDFGAVVDGYRSDMTRTVAVGKVSEKQRFVYNTVLEAQEKALAAIAPEKVCKSIDAIARDHIYSAGFEGRFGHGLGHSVGIEIHEGPSFNRSDETPLKPGMVITVEPGIYLPDEFGVRIEDMIAVTENGCENLTHSTKELIIL
ncbi:MAG: aminopeptidase P family protein [Clostridia bacterium]|nr:aminopeptidase P family protein [Clostridia bacterium]